MKTRAEAARLDISGESGLTLIELMIVLVLSLFLMASVYLTFQIQKKTSDVQHEVVSVQQDVRAVLDIMARDIRQAGCDPTLTGTPGLTDSQCGRTTIAFTTDLNGDGDTSDTDEQVAYSLSGTSLNRTEGGVVTELSSRVTSFGITYYDADNVAIPPTGGGNTYLTTDEASNVRSLDVTVRVRSNKKDPDINDYISRAMSRHLKMRNLGL